MANPQAENGHTDIANEILEALMCVNLSPYQSSVLLCVIRKTWGWRRKFDRIAYRQMVRETGIKVGHVCRTVKALMSYNMLVKNESGQIGFNKDYETWRVTSRGTQKRYQQRNCYQQRNSSSVGLNVTSRGTRALPVEVTKALPAEELQKKGKKLKETRQKKEGARASKDRYLEFVFLSSEEHTKLIERLGETGTNTYIERLNNYIGSTGRKYKSHYHTILNWSSKDDGERIPRTQRPDTQAASGQTRTRINDQDWGELIDPAAKSPRGVQPVRGAD